MKNKTAATIISGTFPLLKYPGKGGWTYVSLPKPEALGKKRFGSKKVSGRIDDYEFTGLSIWNTKAGDLFFPVKAEIRKMIGKTDGDLVTIEISGGDDDSAMLPPDPLHSLLKEEPEARRSFKKLSAVKQKEIEKWIQDARSDESRVQRLAEVLDKLLQA